MVERIVRLLVETNENLSRNVFETILRISKVKEQICIHEV